MSMLSIREEDLINNPTARVPVCLVLDTSGSMSGEPIDELNEGVRAFFEAVKNDELAQHSAEVAVVTFGGTVEVHLDFESIMSQEVPELGTSGSTPMGEAVQKALQLLELRKSEYGRAGVEYYQPWMVLMTDGGATDDIREATRLTRELIEKKKLTIFPIVIGRDEDALAVLRSFSPKRDPLRLRGLDFKAFFEWLSRSVSTVSQSTPGEAVKLDMEGIRGWAEI